MEKLDKAYEALELLESLGLPISIDQQQAIFDLEQEYLNEEILPLLKQELEPLVSKFRGKFTVEISYKRETGLNVHLLNSLTDLCKTTVELTGRGKPKIKKYILRVVFPDGHAVQHQQVLQTLVDVVEFAGAERVRSLNINTVTGNLISDEQDDHERYGVGQKQLSTGQYVQTYSSTDVKYDQIKRINRELGLGLQVEKVLL